MEIAIAFYLICSFLNSWNQGISSNEPVVGTTITHNQVHPEEVQYYYRTTKKFPADDFYSFKVGGTKDDVINKFGKPDFEFDEGRTIRYWTDDGSFLGWTRGYFWEFECDGKGIVIRKGISKDAS
ncbi:hypothetical protein LLG95_14665 [bacterium]|nr:hypothetical protein [bacterium]